MQKKRIAVIMELDWPVNRHYEVLAGIQDYAREYADWDLQLGNYPEIELNSGGYFDGIVGRVTKNCYEAAKAADIPMVNVMLTSPVAKMIPGVHIDFFEAGRIAAEHLISRGLRNLATFGYTGKLTTEIYYQGMLSVTRKYDYPISRHTVSYNYETNSTQWVRFVERVDKCLESWESPIGLGTTEAILARNIAIRSISKGWVIPEKLAIVSCGNDTTICTAVEPTISGVHMGHYQCGYEAAKLLQKLMNGYEAPNEPSVVPMKGLIVRRSSDVFSVRDEKVEEALRYMVDNSSKPLSVSIIAKSIGLGRQSLERRFRKHVDRTINEELIRLRIEALKYRLVQGEEPINQLSREVGFGTAVNMYTMFKRLTGMTPRDYRKLHSPSRN